MLDQNTDRMWYVIGAVLVGAAIILIANSTLPEIFASVTETFENVANNGNKAIEEMEYNQPIANNNPDFTKGSSGWYWRGDKPEFTGSSVKFETGPSQGLTGYSDIFYKVPVRKGETISIDIVARGTGELRVRFGNHTPAQSQHIQLTSEYKKHTVEVKRYAGNENIIFIALPGSSVEIESIYMARLGDIMDDYDGNPAYGRD